MCFKPIWFQNTQVWFPESAPHPRRIRKPKLGFPETQAGCVSGFPENPCGAPNSGLFEFPWTMDPWISVDVRGYPWISMDTHGYPASSSSPNGSPLELRGSRPDQPRGFWSCTSLRSLGFSCFPLYIFICVCMGLYS